ncbi:hypothetical protein SEA_WILLIAMBOONE_115 [Gordonia phage WilliamBoone]|nr:hypothetical protein SEA_WILLIAMBOONE_115 [Gordonia phage WilliamBoone]
MGEPRVVSTEEAMQQKDILA